MKSFLFVFFIILSSFCLADRALTREELLNILREEAKFDKAPSAFKELAHDYFGIFYKNADSVDTINKETSTFFENKMKTMSFWQMTKLAVSGWYYGFDEKSITGHRMKRHALSL